MKNGIFETIAIHHGHPVFIHSHLDRLEYAIEENGLAVPFDRNKLFSEITSRAKGKDDIALKVVLEKSGVKFFERDNPYRNSNYHRGLDICLSSIAMNETEPYRYYKSTQREQLDAEKQNAADLGFGEVIFSNTKGQITEGAVSNIFCVKKGEILTPTVSSGLLDGILRRFLIAIHGGEIKETFLTKEDLWEAEELFLTNSLMGIMPVRSLDGKRYLTGGTGSKLSEYYQTLLHTLNPIHK